MIPLLFDNGIGGGAGITEELHRKIFGDIARVDLCNKHFNY